MTTDQAPTQDSTKNYSILLSLGTYLLRYKKVLCGAGIALVFTAAVTLSMGQGVRLIIDNGFIAGSSEELNRTAMLIIVIACLMAVGTYIRFYLVSWLGERVSADIRRDVFEHLISLHPHYFESNRSGEIMSRLTTDTTLLQTVVGSSASMALRSTLTFVGGLIMLLVTNLKLSGLVLLCVPIVLVPILMFGRRVRVLSRESQDSIADVGSYAGEIIQQIKTVQSYTQEAAEARAFGRHVEHAFDVSKSRIKQRAMLIAVVITLIFSAVAVMLWVGGNDVINGTMSGGELGAFVFYAIIVAGSVATISEVIGELQRAAGAAERLFELLRVESEIVAPAEATTLAQNNSGNNNPSNTNIRFDKVSFSYPTRPDELAVKDLSLDIEAGKTLALVGPSGAGKSTIFELLQRFYDPAQGSIHVGQSDLRRLDPKELRAHIGVVSQQPTLFSGNVWHNIKYGKPDASDQEVYAAAEAAFAHEFIMQLPDGYDSDLGEQGVRLSGGQRQRIAIARAILKNPSILLLDEATSALDAQSEQNVQLALEGLMQDRTTIIIAHRLATIRNADVIVVLEQGELVAQGKHQELLQESPLYRRLSELQFQSSEN